MASVLWRLHRRDAEGAESDPLLPCFTLRTPRLCGDFLIAPPGKTKRASRSVGGSNWPAMEKRYLAALAYFFWKRCTRPSVSSSLAVPV